MRRAGLLVGAALAAAAGLGGGSAAVDSPGAREARASAQAERSPAFPGLSSLAQRLLQSTGTWTGLRRSGVGGYIKHPRGSHKQKRRIAMRGRRR